MENVKNCDYYIVSKDNDFDGFIEEKIKKKYKIKRITEVCQASATKETGEQNSNAKSSTSKSKDNAAKQKKAELEEARRKKEQVIRSHIGKYLKEYNEWKEDIVDAYMVSSSRQELNNRLQQTFENEEVSEILAGLWNVIKNMPGR